MIGRIIIITFCFLTLTPPIALILALPLVVEGNQVLGWISYILCWLLAITLVAILIPRTMKGIINKEI